MSGHRFNAAIGEDVTFKRRLYASWAVLQSIRELDRPATREEILDLALMYGSSTGLTKAEIDDVLNSGWSSFMENS